MSVSIENFYWILYENLLRPTGLDAWYYYPFGTTDYVSQNEFRVGGNDFRSEHHVLFQFDQEPLLDPTSVYVNNFRTVQQEWSVKTVKILANSEHSSLKKQVCKNRNMLDWYYFYHGFAALDWFRDAEFVNQSFPITKYFSSFNHIVTGKRSYRMALTARLVKQGLDQLGDISFHRDARTCQKEINSEHTELSSHSKTLIDQYLLNDIPKILDRDDVDGNFSAHFGHKEYRLWQRSFLHVVNETVFYNPKQHLTEKIFKPIVSLRPFVLVASPGNLAYLKSYGFETFSDWIDESYDSEPDNDVRLDMITREIEKFCKKPISELKSIYDDMLPVLEHNKKHFFGNFRKIIIDELVDNYDHCLRIWNNGRVDGRELSLHPNLEDVKKRLIGYHPMG